MKMEIAEFYVQRKVKNGVKMVSLRAQTKKEVRLTLSRPASEELPILFLTDFLVIVEPAILMKRKMLRTVHRTTGP